MLGVQFCVKVAVINKGAWLGERQSEFARLPTITVGAWYDLIRTVVSGSIKEIIARHAVILGIPIDPDDFVAYMNGFRKGRKAIFFRHDHPQTSIGAIVFSQARSHYRKRKHYGEEQSACQGKPEVFLSQHRAPPFGVHGGGRDCHADIYVLRAGLDCHCQPQQIPLLRIRIRNLMIYSLTMNEWYKDAVLYEIYVRAFADSNGDGHGDLRGVIGKLDYLQELGVDCIWLMPIYQSPLVDDGYDISDYYSLIAEFGNNNDFVALIEAAHARNIRVITDLVMNHTSNHHPWFTESHAAKESPKRDWYVWSPSDQKYKEARIIFTDSQKSNWTLDPQTQEYYWHRFFPEQPDLNFDNPDVQQAILDVMHYWLERGIDGFRCDAVPYLIEREGTNCENLPETHAYLKRMRANLDEHFPGHLLLAEANQWPRDAVAYFGDGDEFQMSFHFPVMPRIFMSLKRADCTPIIEILKQTPPIPPNCQWCTFLRNHDELTLEMVTPEERDWMWREYAPDPRMKLNLGIRRRLAPLLDNDRRKIELAYSLLFTLPGSPIIYYGDEIGMGDNIWLHDRNGVRTPMQWSADRNAGFSDADMDRLYAPVINDPVFGYQKVNVAAQRADPNSLWNTLRHMIATRKQYRVFGRGDYELISLANGAVLGIIRQNEGERVLALHNLSGVEQRAEIRNLGEVTVGARNLLDKADASIKVLAGVRTLKPYEYVWLSVGD